MVTTSGNIYKDGELVKKDARITLVEKPIKGTYGTIKYKGRNHTVSKMGSHWYL